MLSLAILLSLGFAAIFAVSRRSGKRISAAHSNRLRHTTVVGALVVAIVALLAVGAPEADSLQRIARLRLSATTCDHAQMGFAAKLPASKFDEKWPSEAQLGLEPGVSKKVEWALGTSPSSWQHEYDAHPRVSTAAQFVATKAVGETPEAWAARRAGELQGQLPAGSQGRVTMGTGVLEDASGNQIRVISTSEANGYLRPGVSAQPGEIVIKGTGHAEADIVAYANANGLKVVTVGAGRPVCGNCAGAISGSGGTAATPLKKVP